MEGAAPTAHLAHALMPTHNKKLQLQLGIYISCHKLAFSSIFVTGFLLICSDNIKVDTSATM